MPIRLYERTSLRRHRSCGFVFSFIAILPVLAGCSASARYGSGPSPRSVGVRDRYYEQVLVRFEQATLHKPRDGDITGRRLDLAPLIVHEAPRATQGMAPAARFGAIEVTEDGRVRVDSDVPTVYVETGATSLPGSLYVTLTYRWFASIDTPLGPAILETGLRIILGHDGYPMVYETAIADPSIDAPSGLRRLFVSARFEAAAEAEYGPALAGRSFAAERSLAQAPNAIVLRALEGGPQPLGPYVYVGKRSRRILTMHCRCSPSQMDAVLESAYYDLVSFDRMSDLLARVPVGADKAVGDPLRALFDRPLGSVLRWPD